MSEGSKKRKPSNAKVRVTEKPMPFSRSEEIFAAATRQLVRPVSSTFYEHEQILLWCLFYEISQQSSTTDSCVVSHLQSKDEIDNLEFVRDGGGWVASKSKRSGSVSTVSHLKYSLYSLI